jgi:hypothetical protein
MTALKLLGRLNPVGHGYAYHMVDRETVTENASADSIVFVSDARRHPFTDTTESGMKSESNGPMKIPNSLQTHNRRPAMLQH